MPIPGHLVTDFCDRQARVDIPRAVQGSLRSAAPGIHRYLRFWCAAGVPAASISQETARMWIATINPGITYGLYINRLRKADLLLGNELRRRSAEIRAIARRPSRRRAGSHLRLAELYTIE